MDTAEAGDWVECGRAFSAEEIREIGETVAWLPRLARSELAATVCEHLDWRTASGTPKRQACQRLLERLEAAGPVVEFLLHRCEADCNRGSRFSFPPHRRSDPSFQKSAE